MEMRILIPLLSFIVTVASAQNFVPNPSFERGLSSPQNWRLSSGVGRWESFGRTGKRSISVTGDGNDSGAWECIGWKPEGGRLYRIRFFVRKSSDSTDGTPITGFSTVNRDAWDVPNDGQWHQRIFVCRTPVSRETVLRFGQWHLKGTVAFDDVEVLPVIAVHKIVWHGRQQLLLGLGESIRNGVYRFAPNFASYGSNDNRPLFAHTAGFNTDRWVLGGPMSEGWQESGAWVIYRHTLDESRESPFQFTSATLTFVIGYYEGGQLVVEVSKDGKAWQPVGRFAPSGEHKASVPADLFPTSELWVRFWATGNLQVNAYRVEAPLEGDPPDAFGDTWYLAVTTNRTGDTALEIEPRALTEEALIVRVRNEAKRQRRIELTLTAMGRIGAGQKANSHLMTLLPPEGERLFAVPLPKLAAGEQLLTLTVREEEKIVYAAEANVQKPWIEVGGFGYHIAKTDALNLWWCEATYKIGRMTPHPSPQTSRPIRLGAARNEYEPFQLILTPKVPLKRLKLRLSPFAPSARLPSSALHPIWDEVALVDYVPITIPTDAWGSQGDYPDPLVPLWRRDRERGRGNGGEGVEVQVSNLQANQNQPMWLTVFVPKGTPAGTYRATIQIVEAVDERGNLLPAPKSPASVELRVFNFTLPDDTPLRTAYGVGIDNDWHHCRTPAQFRQVWDLYMQTCRRYRISPYSPHAYAPIRWEALGPSTTIDNGVLSLVIDCWQGQVASVAKKNSTSVTIVGSVLPVLEQFEREGVGWEGKGIEWAGAEIVSDIRVVDRNEKRLVLDITAERLTSQPARRKFAVTVRLTIEAGKPYFSVQLLRIVNTDTVRWRINGYYHLLPPNLKPSAGINTKSFGAWLFDSPSLAFGAAGDGFTYSLRINPATRYPHGDVYRSVGRWLEPNEVWEPPNEPIAFVFVREVEQGAQDAGRKLAEFAGKLFQGEVAAHPEGRLQIVERNEPEFRYDFAEFDEAMKRYMDEFRFNGFNLVILPEVLGGHERFSPEWTAFYKRLMAPILEHLKQRGWLKFAYCYWIDEPHTPEQYELTKRGMAALKEALPGVRRLLTNYTEKFPSPTFYGFVDLWVPIFNQFDPQRAKERQAVGEEVWWYVCTGPKAPYPNNFIDHPAITHRIRYWMAAKWNLDGDLYWSMTYWRGKGYRLRNPYEDGQSETPDGGYWGNGDGRLLYPPVRQPLPENAEPVIAPPVPSLRLALIAEGIEDFCYLKLLKRLKDEGQKAKGKSKALGKSLKKADEALGALDRLIRSQTDYEHDPQKLYAERFKIAEAIEKLVSLLEGVTN